MTRIQGVLAAAASVLLACGMAAAQSAAPATSTARPNIHQRSQNQQDRIAQGIHSGQMTPGEAARAENQQRNIHRQVRADRRANGGKLTTQQRRNINRRQNRASRNIYRKKHNANHRS